MSSVFPPHLRRFDLRLLRTAGALLFGALALTLTGCTTGPRVEPVIRATPAQSFTYRILPPDGTESQPGLVRYEEVATVVNRTLTRRGMREARASEPADVMIALDYALGPPQAAAKLIRVPIQRRVYQAAPRINANGANVQIGAHNVDTQLMKPPDVETVGYETRRTPVQIRDKRILIIGRAGESAVLGSPGEELWRVEVASEGESDELRTFLPALSAAGLNYVDRETRGKIAIRLSDTDEVGNFVR